MLGKMRAIRKQIDQGIDTATAFGELGHSPDLRSYKCAAEALRAIGVLDSIALATNNPQKVDQLGTHGFKIHSRVQLPIETNGAIDLYLAMKRDALGHYEKD